MLRNNRRSGYKLATDGNPPVPIHFNRVCFVIAMEAFPGTHLIDYLCAGF